MAIVLEVDSQLLCFDFATVFEVVHHFSLLDGEVSVWDLFGLVNDIDVGPKFFNCRF